MQKRKDTIISLPPSCHSALRAGFAGYSTNPRWNGAKLRAWRLGKEWRRALEAGEMKVCGPEHLLVSFNDCDALASQANETSKDGTSEPAGEVQQSRLGFWRSVMGWSLDTLHS